jgi:hypothetical protein
MYRFSPGDHYTLATYSGFFEDISEDLAREEEAEAAHDAENERREDEGLPSLEEEAAAEAAEGAAAAKKESEKGWWLALPPAAAAGVGIGGGLVALLLLMAIFGGRK